MLIVTKYERHTQLKTHPVSLQVCTKIHEAYKVSRLQGQERVWGPAHRARTTLRLPAAPLPSAGSCPPHAPLSGPGTCGKQIFKIKIKHKIWPQKTTRVISLQVGLFRKSGAKSRIQALRHRCDASPDSVDYEEQSAYDVADMVKQFFRDLPEPLLSNKLGETFLHIYQCR